MIAHKNVVAMKLHLLMIVLMKTILKFKMKIALGNVDVLVQNQVIFQVMDGLQIV